MRDVEATLGRNIAARAVVVGPLLIAVFWLTRGWDGAWASAVGVGVVAGNFVLSGFVLSKAFNVSPQFYHAAALFGFLLRLGLITVALLVLAALVEVDRMALGVTAVVSYLALLTWETAAVAGRAERKVEWTS